MATEKQSNVDAWLEQETDHVRNALESASRYFDGNDQLTVNTLEAVYGQESTFGTKLNERGIESAAGHFMLEAKTAKRYGLIVSKKNDQRFDIDYASSAAARYLKDLDTFFSKTTNLGDGRTTTPIHDSMERKKFVLGAYNAGEGRLARAQRLAEEAKKDPQLWSDVKDFLESAGALDDKANEIREYVQKVPSYETEFAEKSKADTNIKQKDPKKDNIRCTEGHWRTIDDRRVFICD